MFATNTSAGVYYETIDNSAALKSATGGIATLCLPLPWGPVGVSRRTLASELEAFYGTSTKFWRELHKLRLLCKQANWVNVTRIALDPLYAATMYCTYNNMSTCRELGAGLTTNAVINFSDHDIMAVVGRYQGERGAEYYTACQPDTTDATGLSFNFMLYKVGTTSPLRVWYGCTLFHNTDDNGNQTFIEDVINGDPLIPVQVFVNPNHYKLAQDEKYAALNTVCGGPRNSLTPTAPHGQLLGGSDGQDIDIYGANAGPALAAFVEAWEQYDDWETYDLGIACDGGYSHPVIAATLDTLCKSRSSDAIAINNVPAFLQTGHEAAVAYRHGTLALDGYFLGLGSTPDSTLCYNDLEARDSTVNRTQWIPMSVALCYTMLECDKTFSWLAPAGLNRGGLPWATKLRCASDIGVRDILNDNQIIFPIHFKNPQSSADPVGIYVWNADTLNATNSALDDIGVQRLLSVLTRSTRAQFLYYNFEADDSVLRTTLVNNLKKNILEPCLQGEGLDWYDVICDETTTSNQDVANGDLLINIFLDPTRYTKRILLNLNVAPTGQVNAVVSLIERGQ